MRLTDHVTLNFNNNLSTAAVFLDIEKAFDTTWHPGMLYKPIKLNFPASTVKLISSFLSNRKFKVSVEGEMSTSREIQAGVPQGSILSPILYNLYINYACHICPVLHTEVTYDYFSLKQEIRTLLLSENPDLCRGLIYIIEIVYIA
jgi:hypothetical protein